MSLTGNISTMSLAEIFQWLNSGRKTGTLHVDGPDGIKKDVYFGDGLINSASSSDPRELIGQFLLVSNQITEQQLSEALERQKRDHVLLGKILVQQNIITKDELHELLTTISEEIIYDLFLWKEGKFEFFDGKLPAREIPKLALDVTHIVLEGARREDEWSRVKEVFPDDSIVIRPNVEKIIPHLPLDSRFARLLSLVNGIRNILEIARLFKSTRFEVCRFLLDLHEAGMIEVGSHRHQMIQPPSSGSRDPMREMIGQVEGFLEEGRLEEAERGLMKLQRSAPNNPQVKKLKSKIQDKRYETTAKQVINPDAIPVLAMDVGAITRLDLSPEAGFIVSRINGAWDVKSIIKISPFEESLCLKIFKNFLDNGVISFK
ncbi:DUF4388 domain-containing protein [Sulfidibacter corallicola]|uniref:DUF4388 domain-containing protein n=1 Tax=Sulfidibacter corallicola TaxID=2818388 RepID=A0A8A4TW93_SULCO|nr:DUF4388 domain-containing protein [Sulfidibacter corallicola]QTD53627.1 DUF4388 domain-containing protein [Sulfidibacter corallicola]